MGKVYSQVAGHVQIVKANTWNKLPMDSITVDAINSADAKQANDKAEEGSNTFRVMQPRTGDEVYARVMKVEDRFAKVDILAIGEDPISAVFVGFI